MKGDSFEIEEGLFDLNAFSDFKALIDLEVIEEDKEILTSNSFIGKSQFLKELFTHDIKEPSTNLNEEKSCEEQSLLIGTDRIILRGWKNVENVSARLINDFDDTVVLECLIDKENGIYEEREFRKSMFEGYDTSLGSLYLLRIFERQNELRIEIHNDPDLTLKDDFPKLNFAQTFKDSRLFKKK